MKALVTGGAGFIGSNLVKALIELGTFEITVIDNLSTGFRENLDSCLDKVAFIEGDIRDADLINSVTKHVDIIFHLAAHVGNIKSIEHPVRDAEINIVGSLNILQAAKNNGIKKIVYSSSAATLGEPEYLPIDEKHPTRPSSFYGVSKLSAEKYVLSYGQTYNIPVVCLRYFNVYGENQKYDAYGNVIPIFVERIIGNKDICIYGDGKQTRDFVNVKDVVQANVKSAKYASVNPAVFNIGTGNRTSINELSAILKEIFHQDIKVNYAPPRVGEVIDSCADINSARKYLKYEPEVSLHDGLVEYIKWYETAH